MALDLRGRCVVVTGGAHGIGRALAESFAARAAAVTVSDVQAERAARAARIGAVAIICGLGDPVKFTALVEEAERT
jgi:NAD(P)-dependent dehydrogenase (short-subunit alcohol dehydrogenase family)